LVAALLFVTAGTASAVTLATIYEIQQMVYPENTVVKVDTVLVTGIDSAPTTYGFWAQQKSGGPFGGIQVYSGNTSTGGLRVGHVVTIDSIKYLEYPSGVHDSLSGSELIYSPLAWTIVDSMIVPAPTLLQCGDFPMGRGYLLAEQWEGSLVRLDDVVVTMHDPSFASSYFIQENAPSTDTTVVYVRNNKLTSPGPGRPPIGQVLSSMTGIAHFENGRYHICPRNVDDIVYAGAPPAPNLALAYAISNTGVNAVFDTRVDEATAENINNYSLGSGVQVLSATLDLVGEQIVTLTTGTQTGGTAEELTVAGVKSKGPGTIMPQPQISAFRGGLTPISMVQAMKAVDNDSSALTLEQVTVAGIVTADKTPYVTHCYVEERPGGPWQGVQIYGGVPVNPTEGDSIIISGYVSEYFFKTEITGIDYLQICSSGNPLPGPAHVDPGVIKTGAATAESYEGVFVRCDPVFVADTVGFDQFGEWRVADTYGGLDTAMVGHNGNYTYIPVPGTWMNIRGPIDYIYEDFRIEPRRDADIDLVNVIGVDPGTPAAPAVFTLEQNFPNPFNPVTTIVFSLPEKGEAMLAVYDVSGRLVKTLHEGVLDQGRHKATWDGSNNAGRTVSSGVYFAKLVTKNNVAETKMVILK
jgi:hypothetical protein